MADKKKHDPKKQNPDDHDAKNHDVDEKLVIRDKRRVDPVTGAVRSTAHESADASASDRSQREPPLEPAEDSEEADRLTDDDLTRLLEDTGGSEPGTAGEADADYKRLQAEYFNYRKRVERDRQANREIVIAEVVKSLLPVLDDLDRAHAHGDLEGSPLDLVAQKLRAAFERYGLKLVGETGEVFDPTLHEAIFQQPTADVTVNTVADVIESGYLLGERLLRPAKVSVSVPTEN